MVPEGSSCHFFWLDVETIWLTAGACGTAAGVNIVRVTNEYCGANFDPGDLMTSNQIEPAALEELRKLDSCSVANAIEKFGVRLRNSGFTDSSVRCIFEDFPPLLGYAATVRIRTADPPMEGDSYYYGLDWLDHLLSIPAPRVLVVEDMDPHPGLGSFVGDVHANILRALGCAGLVTNGAVRNVEAVRALKFQMFAGNLSVSHGFAHVFDFGGPVRVGQMAVRPGELVHGDRHGAQTIPIEIAQKIPSVAQRMNGEEREIIEFCQSGAFTLEKLRSDVAALRIKRKNFNP
jgi:regulator of RNase E activity RraA